MSAVITMDQFGRLVLPDEIRKALNLSDPAAFRAEVVGNKVELTVLPESAAGVKNENGLLVVSTGGKKFKAADAIRSVREERL